MATIKKFLDSQGTTYLWQKIAAELSARDQSIATNNATATEALATANAAMPKTGGTFTGEVILNAAPTADLGAATKKYVDDSISNIPDAPTYSIAKLDTAESGYAASYKLMSGDTQQGATINIPKDMVVESGSVVEVTAAQAGTEGYPASAGTYIRLVLSNATNDKIWVNVGDLIEYVTSGSAAGDMVVIAVDDNHQVTATITDGTITKAKLASAVQTSLTAADNAMPKSGGTFTGSVILNAAPTVDLEAATKKYVDDTKDALIGADTDTNSSNTIIGAKKYADYLGGNYATSSQGLLADSALQPADVVGLTTGEIDAAIAAASSST